MAEALFKSIAETKGLDVSVSSAGVFASPHGKASAHAVEALFEKRIALNHSSSPLSEEHIETADLVLAMTEQHKQLIEGRYQNSQGKVFTIKEYVTGKTAISLTRSAVRLMFINRRGTNWRSC